MAARKRDQSGYRETMISSPPTTPKPFVFVLMPFAKQFNDIYKFGIKGAAEDVGAYAERLDEQIFTEGMLERIFNQISKADVVVADMTGQNANVFYEVGYAHALGKIVLLLTQQSDDIPFDLRHRPHIVYHGAIEALRADLARKLGWAINEAKMRAGGALAERFLVSIGETDIPVAAEGHQVPTIRFGVTGYHFRIRLAVRNGSSEPAAAATHLYLLAPEDALMLPANYAAFPLGAAGTFTNFTLNYGQQPIPLSGVLAGSDALLGRAAQYRLEGSIGPLPPNAIDELTITFVLEKDRASANVPYKLRIHTSAGFHDYPFRLQVEVEKPQTGN
jgi:hypothetical protein